MSFERVKSCTVVVSVDGLSDSVRRLAFMRCRTRRGMGCRSDFGKAVGFCHLFCVEMADKLQVIFIVSLLP